MSATSTGISTGEGSPIPKPTKKDWDQDHIPEDTMVWGAINDFGDVVEIDIQRGKFTAHAP